MSSFQFELEDELVALLHQSNQSVESAVREFIVLELYRRGTISSGKAAELLHMSRFDFIHYASCLGIPFLTLTEDEWSAESRQSQNL